MLVRKGGEISDKNPSQPFRPTQHSSSRNRASAFPALPFPFPTLSNMRGLFWAIHIFALVKIILPWSASAIPVHEINLTLMLAV